MKTLAIEDVQWMVDATQDDASVRGNALASGDDAEDKACEDAILARLDAGDAWAWASVRVTGTYRGLKAHDYLGCCCYEDEADFRENSGYFQDMQSNVLAELQAMVEDIVESVA
jgi:hypothetical protein